jgi:hypothetical protein
MLERAMDLLGERVAGGARQRPGGGAGGIVPERERGVEMGGVDLVGVVEQAYVSAGRMACASARALTCPLIPGCGWASCW